MSAETRAQRSEDKRRRLLDAAEQIYRRDGDLGLTVRRLAKEATTTSQTIYTYYGSRDAVIDAMYERALAQLDGLLDELAASVEGRAVDAPAALLGLVSIYRRYCLDRPAHFSMLTNGLAPAGTDPSSIGERRERLVELIGRASRSETDRSQQASGSGYVTLAAINGFVTAELHSLLDEQAHPEKLLADLVDGLVAGGTNP